MNLPFHFMVNMVACWVNRRQQAIVEYLIEDTEVLIAELGAPKPVEEMLKSFGVETVLCPLLLNPNDLPYIG